MAIVSNGVYPTPTPTDTKRAALAVSFGLLNITLPTGVVGSISNVLLRIGKAGINIANGLLKIG